MNLHFLLRVFPGVMLLIGRGRKRTPKQRARADAYRKFCDGMAMRCPFCEVCRRKPSSQIHHIARGVDRQATLCDRRFVLCLCFDCHEDIHDTEAWPRARQLAVVKRARPDDYDLAAYNEIVNRSVDESEVEAWA